MPWIIEPPPDADARAAERAFAAFAQWDALMSNDGKGAPAEKIAFSRLFRYAENPTTVRDPELEHVLARDPSLRADHRRLLERFANYWIPRLAAAAGGEIARREGDGCRIRLERSVAEPDQTYVIIELADPTLPGPTRIFIVDAHNQCKSYPLPPLRDGIIQLLEDGGSELVAGLRDIETEVFLR